VGVNGWMQNTNRAIGTWIKFLLLCGILVVIVYAFGTVYVNFIAGDGMPRRANYEVYITNTGGMFLADELTDENGIVTVTGYYEKQDGKWVYKPGVLKLDEKYYGNVEVKKR